ncbi:mucin-binding protein [Limosilactobacillus difficilis]|uniref:mucin-binding protein n=1 Tax=Limosilactobacillus difficilis TaxID=2991838 RepID=UPI0024B91727|nr:hypothetical protein [Limosilactobacillus difficilis]
MVYTKPYVYTLNSAGTEYVLTQTGDVPADMVATGVQAPQTIAASQISAIWNPAGKPLFGKITGQGQPSSLVSANDNETGTTVYDNNNNNQAQGYPKYSATVDSSNVNWPIFGRGPVAMFPFPSVTIYGATANNHKASVRSDTTDVKADLGDAANYVNTTDLTAAHHAAVKSVDWQTLPSLAKANANAAATVRIHFTDGSYFDVPVTVNVVKVDQGVDNQTDHDLYRDITRTINVEGESAPVVQHVIYTRAKITDLAKPAGQQVSYTAWAAGKNDAGETVTNFPQFDVSKAGYTATATGATIATKDGKQFVPASATITPESANETVNVTYTANDHAQVINFVDGSGHQVGGFTVNGKTGATVAVDIANHVPAKWELVPGQQVPTQITFGTQDPAALTYKVQHKTENVPVDRQNKDTYREVTETIQTIPAGQTAVDPSLTQIITVPFQRTGVKDLVTGQITCNAWQGPQDSIIKDGQPTYTIKAQNVQQVKGYDSYVNGQKAMQVAAVDVNAASNNITATISYTKQGNTAVKYDASRDDMKVSRTINYEVPAGQKTIDPVTQTVEYTREDSQGNAGYQDPDGSLQS